MSKNDPTGKTHYDVTKTTSNHGASNTELKTPKNILSGLSGVLADCASNDSDSTSVGSGSKNHTQSSRSGLGGGVSLKPSKSNSVNFGR